MEPSEKAGAGQSEAVLENNSLAEASSSDSHNPEVANLSRPKGRSINSGPYSLVWTEICSY